MTRIAVQADCAARLAAPKSTNTLTILLTDDATVRDLNARFRHKDAPTNVLAFPSAPGAGHLGDIALAFDVCAREAREQGKTLADHLGHLVIHGVLHLGGHDHETDEEAEAMETLERTLLSRLGVGDPYAARDLEAAGA
jgi:probable rRNA maturation factor